jgi:hypothetical protein
VLTDRDADDGSLVGLLLDRAVLSALTPNLT